MSTPRLAWLLLVSIVLLASSAFAQSPTDLPPSPPTPAYYLFRALISLALIVALIYAIYFGLRRLSHFRSLGASDEQMQLLDSRHLGGGRWIYAVKVADRVLIIGGGTDGLRALAEIPTDLYQEEIPGYEEDSVDANN